MKMSHARHTLQRVPGKNNSSVLALLDREQAILQFNRRVLAQALRADVPLLERLRYVTIVSSNVDEFFEVRVADVLEAVRRPDSPYGRSEMRAMTQAAHALVTEQYNAFNDVVMPALAAQGIVDRDVTLPPAFRAAVRVQVLDRFASVLPTRS